MEIGEASSNPDFVLKWGKRKRLRVVKKITSDSTVETTSPPSQPQPPRTPSRLHIESEPTTSSFVLQWGRRKRLRCISRNVATSEQRSDAIMSLIPEDIIIDILTRLPAKSLLRFRCVCKSWYELLKTSNFAELHLNHSLKYGEHGIVYNNVRKISCVHIDYPSEHKMERILGSCNGLVCYLSSRKGIIIWNPCTKYYKKLPTPPKTDVESRGFHVTHKYGFGYDLKSKDYKFARLANIRSRYSEIAVYSLKLNLWKTYRILGCPCPYGDLVLFQGILHWMEMPPWGSVRPRTINSFDIDSKAFKRIPLPQQFSNKFNIIHVRLLGGCLHLIGSLYMTCSEVWMMKDYGVHESWTKMFAIDNTKHAGFTHLDIRQCYRNGVVVVQENHLFTYLYDLNHEEDMQLKVMDGIPLGFQTWPFLGSLVFPNLGT